MTLPSFLSKGLEDNLEFLAEEIEEKLGVKLEFPLDRTDREYGFFCAVSDYLMEPDTLMGNAAVIAAYHGTMTALLYLIIAGFPLAMYIGWRYDITVQDILDYQAE